MKRPGFSRMAPESTDYDPIYSQSHLPVRKQNTAEGHAVRALYLYCAMADLAEECNDGELLEQCKILWNNIVQKRMYITGSVGSSGFWERFTVDYDLPNDSNYSETCASIALAMFGIRMARITGDASYIDTVERALYNTIRSGISLEGDRYFYVNPLEVWPENCIENSSRSHIKPIRQKWFDCACCPTNVARTLTNLGQYIYSIKSEELFINLFIQNETSFEINGKPVALSIITNYPKTGLVKVSVKAAEVSFSLNIRIPGFAEGCTVSFQNSPETGESRNSYFCIKRIWNDEEITVSFDMKPRLVYGNPRVHQNCGKVAIARGPEIYCLEEVDNDANLAAIELDTCSPLMEEWHEELLGGIMLIKAEGFRLITPVGPESFSEKFYNSSEQTELTAIPYGFWGNRTPTDKSAGEMVVWIRSRYEN
jgi:DUF1680 family protein